MLSYIAAKTWALVEKRKDMYIKFLIFLLNFILMLQLQFFIQVRQLFLNLGSCSS
jgi:hypothetical protein